MSSVQTCLYREVPLDCIHTGGVPYTCKIDRQSLSYDGVYRAATNCDVFVLTKARALSYYPEIAEQIREVAGNRANWSRKGARLLLRLLLRVRVLLMPPRLLHR